MIMVNIYEAKARLSEYVQAAARGERIMICNRNQPVAELRAVEQKRTKPRPVGGGPHAFDLPSSFFEPLTDAELDAWNGVALPVTRRVSPRVAERPAKPYGSAARRKRRR